MPIYAFSDAIASLNARLGHRTDLTNTQLQKWLDQAQYVIATNIRGMEELDETSPPTGLIIGQAQYAIWQFTGLANFWALRSVHNDTDKILMQRAEWDLWSQMPQPIPNGIPTQWARYGDQFYLFQAPAKSTTLTFYYRRTPTPGAIEVGDEWYDHLVQLAQFYALSEIGKAGIKRDVLGLLPQQIQLAVTHPLTPLEWEATHDPYLGAYPMR